MKRFILCTLAVSSIAHAQPQPDQPPPQPVPPVVEVQPVPPPPPPPVQPREEPVAPKVDPPSEGTIGNDALLFNLNNVFTQGAVLGGWQGFGFGAQRKTGSGKILRIGLELARLTDPVDIVKTTRTNGTDVVVSYDINLPASGFSAQHAGAIVIDSIKPLTERSMAPYLGAGLVAGYLNQKLSYTDDVTVLDTIIEVANTSHTLTVGVRGIVGVNWRINERFALFAEYHVTVNAFSWQSVHEEETTQNSTSGTPATMRVERDFSEQRWFNIDLGLGQGGALGLVAHF